MSTRPAALTAATSVDSAGLAEAAVATGAVDIPLKLPAPDFGTEAQAGPKSMAAAAAADAEDAARRARTTGAEDVEPEAAVEDADEPHAAVPRPRLTARPDRARRRYFTVLSLMVIGFLCTGRWIPGCGAVT